MFRLLCLLHFFAVTLICTAPVITYVGDSHLGIEWHVGDADDSEKDSEDEKDHNDVISEKSGNMINTVPLMLHAYDHEESGILNDEHLDVFSPPPEL